ncbi:MAG: SagB/ThcOx family dehydrogenase [Candidatus Symbiothrix sp.]|jgi:SagB-type dehydrogenase family enzyme|nr:SagB/ThcOx family dehydrogenase [Candidatus Symbiothrix sp.]
MRFISLIVTALLFATTVSAQSLIPVKLNAPSKERGSDIMEALANRHSTREFSTEKLSLQDLSDLLWAATGVNRPDGRRTAATARNNQDIDVYVIMEEGAYLYDVKAHELQPVAEGDHRGLIADAQASVKAAPVSLLMVSDLSRFTGLDAEAQKQWGALDAGIVSQNIMLFASACGLATVPRVYMKKDELKEVLHLSETQVPMINNPVGYPL